MSPGNLGRRLAVAALGIPTVLGLLVVGGWPLTAAMAIISVLVTWELFALAEIGGTRAFFAVGVLGSLALVFIAGHTRSYELAAPWDLAVILGTFLVSSTLAVKFRWPAGRPLAAVSVTLLGVVMGGGCFSFALFLRYLPDFVTKTGVELSLGGPTLVAFPIAVTWVGDSVAYFLGSLFGKRKLIPAVSPNKTVEGGVAGLIASLLVGALVGWRFLELHPSVDVSIAIGALIGLLLGFGAQLGDLAESATKREAGVKDSGRLLPGHGGFLDRFDALMFNLPLAYLLVQLTGLLS